MKMTKKSIIEKLRSYGVTAYYKNICWCRNITSDNLVGGIIYFLKGREIVFTAVNGEVKIVNDYNELRPYIFK